MVIGFFDLRLSGFERFPKWIWERHSKSHKLDANYVFYYCQADIPLSDVKKRLADNIALVNFVKIKYENIESLSADITERKIRVMVVMAQRIPDNFVVLSAKMSNVPTLMLQHGLYVPFMRRNARLFIENIRKTFLYIYLLKQVSKHIEFGPFKTFCAFIKHYIYGRLLGSQEFPNEKLACDLVFVHGEYWKEFHKKQFGYSFLNQVVVGSHDFNIRDVGEEKYDVRICYVAQTLVEDGRLSRERMERFVESFLKPIAEIYGDKFVLKLHPRSDLSLYKQLSTEATIERKYFPSSSVVIGHYSSLLIESITFTDKLFLFEFNGHRTPEYLEMIASDIFKEGLSFSDLTQVVADRESESICHDKRLSLQDRLSYYFGDPAIDSLGAVADLIMLVAKSGALPNKNDVKNALLNNHYKKEGVKYG